MTSASPTELSAGDLLRIEDLLREAIGLTLSKGLRNALRSSVANAARSLELSIAQLLGRLVAADPDALGSLVDHSVVGETYFFRHPEQYEALREVVLPELGPRETLRLWSAGCASGEEPYSLAMTLFDAGRHHGKDRITATDVSTRALARAAQATYGPWSLRRIDPGALARHFESTPAGQLVAPRARQMVELRHHNLVADPPPVAGCDIVSCRNVLIYFDDPTATRVLAGLWSALRPGGWLLISPVELPMARSLEADWVEVRGATLLRRPEAKPPARAKPAFRLSLVPAPKALSGAPRTAPDAGSPPPLSAVAARPSGKFDEAREAARRGELVEAERLASEVAATELRPEAFLLLSMAAEHRGDLAGAVEAVRRALYLDPGLASGHAALVALFTRLGRGDEAERARRNAVAALEGLDDEAELAGVEPLTAGALRRALGGGGGGG